MTGHGSPSPARAMRRGVLGSPADHRSAAVAAIRRRLAAWGGTGACPAVRLDRTALGTRGGRAVPAVLARPGSRRRQRAASTADLGVSLAQTWPGWTSARSAEQAVLETGTRARVGGAGHGHTSEVTPSRAFRELGFDSLTAVELRNRLAHGDRVAAARHADLRSPESRGARGAPARQAAARRAPARRRLAALDRLLAEVGRDDGPARGRDGQVAVGAIGLAGRRRSRPRAIRRGRQGRAAMTSCSI